MPVSVVELLKVIDVDHDDAEGLIDAGQTPPFARENFIERTAVGDACHPIHARDAFQRVAGVFEFQMIPHAGA